MEATVDPTVSVVIPAYNQAHYLAEAIQSVVNQTFKDYEIIVVDDGSTDDTRLVAQKFEPLIRYIYQENQGLAGARNTGIQNARGELVALLDSDDAWLPTFLASMLSLVKAQPEAAIYYCGVLYISSQGSALPQIGKTRILPPEIMYNTILRMNFLIPSTILMRRAIVTTAGLFDVNFRRLQDWELWVRLLRHGYSFAGLDRCLVRYRIHDNSLSTDPVGGQRAAMALAVKHFGPDDGQWEKWPEDKRRMFGGVYRYYALTTSLIRDGDWSACAHYLGRSLLIDPSLAHDLDLFYELILGTQPPGRRGHLASLDLKQSEQMLAHMLSQLFVEVPAVTPYRQSVYSHTHYALGLLYYGIQQSAQARRHLWRSFTYWPQQATNRQWCMTLLKSLAPDRLVQILRAYQAEG